MLRREGDKLVFTGFGESRLEYFDSISQIFQAQLKKCGQCVKLCPQEIDIPDVMMKFADMIANPPPSP